MNRPYLAIGAFILTSCSSNSDYAIDASNDLHCAVVIRSLEKSAIGTGAPPDVKKGLYALQTWYFSKISHDQLVDAQGVAESVKQNPDKVPHVGQECSKRAYNDAYFQRWNAIASDDYNKKGGT